MKDNRRYIFTGNRFFVLQKMIELNLNIVKIFVVRDSFCQKELETRGIEFEILSNNKNEFVNILFSLDYDILVSNGCPFILPISQLSNGSKKFINLYPSLLPDLKGKSPINGALLFERRHGVTCHNMDDGIDTGAIIEQLEIPIGEEINLDLLYQLSFRAEAIAFENAYKKNFEPLDVLYTRKNEDNIYYSKKHEDRIIRYEESFFELKRKIKAFSSYGQYAFFFHKGKPYEVVDIALIKNPMADLVFNNKSNNKIVCVYGIQFVLVKFDNKLCQFILVNNDGFCEGDNFIDN